VLADDHRRRGGGGPRGRRALRVRTRAREQPGADGADPRDARAGGELSGGQPPAGGHARLEELYPGSIPRAIARRSRALSRIRSSTPFSSATSRMVRLLSTASLTISVALS